MLHCWISFEVSDVSSSAEPIERAEQIWRETLSERNVAVFVSADNAQIGCKLHAHISAKIWLRAGRRHGFLENVVTHPAFQGQGHGRAVVGAALAEAWTRLPPAVTLVEVSKLYGADFMIEIEAIAAA